MNPERNWGPKTRAAQGSFGDDRKRVQNQGKKRKKMLEVMQKEAKKTLTEDAAK